MAKIANEGVIDDGAGLTTKDGTLKRRTVVNKSREVVKDSLRYGYIRFKNISDVNLQIVNHTIEVGEYKDFYKSIGYAIMAGPIIENYVRLKMIEIIDPNNKEAVSNE